MIVLGENEEVANQIVDKSIGELLQKYGGCLHELHVTDQQVYNKYPVFMRTKIEIGNTEESIEKANKLLHVIFTIIDKVVRLKLSDSTKNKCLKNRKSTITEKAKQETEKRQEEDEERLRKEALLEKEKLRKMTPEQRRKYEEKKKV